MEFFLSTEETSVSTTMCCEDQFSFDDVLKQIILFLYLLLLQGSHENKIKDNLSNLIHITYYFKSLDISSLYPTFRISQ